MQPPPPVVHYERERPSEMLHLAINDHSRLAYTEGLADEQRETTTGLLPRAIDWIAAQGITTERVMTDNSSACRSRCFDGELRQDGIVHLFTKPEMPRANGKAERYVQTALRARA